MNSYEARLEAKRARLEKASERASDEATARFGAAHRAVEGIPFGQPILVGHHSEGRHRSALKRADTNMRKACEATDRAAELAYRAAAVGTGGIASEDPDAVEKLTDKRTELEQRRDNMKAANAFYKTHKTLDGWDGPADIRADGEVVLRVQAYYGKPFPPYSFSNLGARIRQAAKRTEQVAALHAQFSDDGANDIRHETAGSATITTDPSDMRVLVAFPARLSKENYKMVRSHGFVWAPSRNAFSRRLTHPNVVEIARQMVAALALQQASDPLTDE